MLSAPTARHHTSLGQRPRNWSPTTGAGIRATNATSVTNETPLKCDEIPLFWWPSGGIPATSATKWDQWDQWDPMVTKTMEFHCISGASHWSHWSHWSHVFPPPFSDSNSWGVAPGWYGAAPLALKALVFLPSVPLCVHSPPPITQSHSHAVTQSRFPGGLSLAAGGGGLFQKGPKGSWPQRGHDCVTL